MGKINTKVTDSVNFFKRCRVLLKKCLALFDKIVRQERKYDEKNSSY